MAQIAAPALAQQSALRMAHRTVCRGWAWAPAWLPAGAGPASDPRCPATLALSARAAVAHSGELRGPRSLSEGAARAW
eukprot:2907434-Alexandrium_andersonii.AAC.1